jgi:hypothetical protein
MNTAAPVSASSTTAIAPKTTYEVALLPLVSFGAPRVGTPGVPAAVAGAVCPSVTVTVGAAVTEPAVPFSVGAAAASVAVSVGAVDTPVLAAAGVGGSAVAAASVAVGAMPPRGSCPQIWLNVMSCGAGALFRLPLPHFQPWTSPSFAFSRLNASAE